MAEEAVSANRVKTFGQMVDGVDMRISPQPVLAVIIVLAIAFSSFPGLMSADLELPFGLAFFSLPLLVWTTFMRWPRLGRWLSVLVTGLAFYVMALAVQVPGAWALAILPVILGAAIMGFAGSIVVATLQSVLIAATPLWGGVAFSDIVFLVIWGAVAALLLIYFPLDEFARWSWGHYVQAQSLLDDARDRQVELRQVLTDLADANVQLDRMNRLAQGLREEAEDARRAKEQFVANLSHELRTPLNMIVGFSQMIGRSPRAYGANLPPTLLSDLNVILRNSQHLSSLIDDVLDLSQIEAGRMALTKERVALNQVVEAACTAVRPLYESKGLVLKISMPAGLPLVFCDQVRIREVLLNLLSNAGRFTERGGVTVDVQQDRDSILFSVTDTGPGIAAEHKDRIFRPFEQVDGSIRRTHNGSGLGLSISKAFVELHGGQMWFESQVGQGTTFFIRLTRPCVASMTALHAGCNRGGSSGNGRDHRAHPSPSCRHASLFSRTTMPWQCWSAATWTMLRPSTSQASKAHAQNLTERRPRRCLSTMRQWERPCSTSMTLTPCPPACQPSSAPLPAARRRPANSDSQVT